MTEKAWTLSRDGDIATLTFDLPGEKINKFTNATMRELDKELDQVGKVKALIFRSAKKGVFIAGADLTQFETILKSKEKVRDVIEAGHDVFGKIASLPFPTIAVIDGACLGGGLEMALACSHRIVTDHSKTSLGLPEVSIGVIPGWGGTQRLPRLVGLQQGLKMILGSKPVDGKKAFKIGLADQILPHAFLEEQLPEAIDKCCQGKTKARKMKWSDWLLEGNPIGRSLIFSQARKNVEMKTKGHYPAPLIALETIKKTISKPLNEGLKEEVEAFVSHSDKGLSIAPHLIRIFFGMERLKKQETSGAHSVKSVGVLGAGTMGSGIAWLASYRGLDVRVKDINWDALANGYQEIERIYGEVKKIKRLSKDTVNLMLQRVGFGIDDEGFSQQDLVIEAATENLDLKKKLFNELEKRLAPDALIASNTSSLTIEEMASEMAHPERFVGMHFFNPVNRMPLVEIVAGPKTSKESVDRAVKACLDWKKIPIVVGDCAGFLVNRIFAVQANEVMHLLQEGIDMARLDHICKKFGWPMGPFVLADTVGNDVGYKVFKEFEKAYGERMKVPEIVIQMADKGLTGKKSGKGFYLYNGKTQKPNPKVDEILKTIGVGDAEYTDAEMLDRIIAAMLNEACRCLEENIIDSHTRLDMALILGTGFPPFRGGLLAYSNERGIKDLVGEMKELEIKHGLRFKPCSLVNEMAEKNLKFDV